MNKQLFTIAQVVDYYPPVLGGVENCAKSIADELAKKDYRVKVFTSDIGNKAKVAVRNGDQKVRYLKSVEIAHTPIIFSLFFHLIALPKNSIIHLHIVTALTPEIVWLAAKIRGIRYIAHLHSDVKPSGSLGFLLPIYKKIFLPLILNSASMIIVPSPDYIGIAGDLYPISNKKIIAVTNGLYLDNFKKNLRKTNDPIKLLSVGRIDKYKNIPLLIESFKKISDKNPLGVELHIVGDGKEKNKVESLIKKLGLENRVFMHGSLKGQPLYDMYLNSDIFILTSIFESFGIVLLEAMAAGLPIIASDIPGVRNVVEHNKTGLLARLTPDDFAAGIEKLMADFNLRESLVKSGLESVKKYDWSIIASEYGRIYQLITNDYSEK